jgi:EmrB/QacA subfamily drug resistance transporter
MRTDSPDSIRGHEAAVLAVILTSYVMIVLDISVVITGLPRLAEELGFTEPGLSWVQSIYTLFFGGFLLLGARMGDMFGMRRMFLTGLAVFTGASLVIGLAPTAGWLLAARGAQGVGSAILAPATLALLQATFPPGPQRTRAVAYYGAAAGIAASIGLVAGGLLTDFVSWRAGFLINLPIGLAVGWATLRLIDETPRRPGGRLDIAGALVSTVGMGALVYGALRAAEAGWSDPLTVAALAGGGVVLVLFIRIEARAAQPIMPLRLFVDAERVTAYAGRALFLGGMISFFFFLTLYMQDVLMYPPSLAGLAFLPAMLVNFGIALLVPRLTARFGNLPLLTAGLMIAVVGMAWLSRATPATGFWLAIGLPSILVGVGQGCALSPLTASGIARVAPGDAGAAAGVVNVAHQLGSALGLGLTSAIAAPGAAALTGTDLMMHRYQWGLTAACAMLALAMLMVMRLTLSPRKAPKRKAI